MTVREAMFWLGVPEDEPDLGALLRVPSFRRAVLFVANEHHVTVHRGVQEPYPGLVLDRYHVPTNRNGDLDLAWLRDIAIRVQP